MRTLELQPDDISILSSDSGGIVVHGAATLDRCLSSSTHFGFISLHLARLLDVPRDVTEGSSFVFECETVALKPERSCNVARSWSIPNKSYDAIEQHLILALPIQGSAQLRLTLWDDSGANSRRLLGQNARQSKENGNGTGEWASSWASSFALSAGKMAAGVAAASASALTRAGRHAGLVDEYTFMGRAELLFLDGELLQSSTRSFLCPLRGGGMGNVLVSLRRLDKTCIASRTPEGLAITFSEILNSAQSNSSTEHDVPQTLSLSEPRSAVDLDAILRSASLRSLPAGTLANFFLRHATLFLHPEVSAEARFRLFLACYGYSEEWEPGLLPVCVQLLAPQDEQLAQLKRLIDEEVGLLTALEKLETFGSSFEQRQSEMSEPVREQLKGRLRFQKRPLFRHIISDIDHTFLHSSHGKNGPEFAGASTGVLPGLTSLYASLYSWSPSEKEGDKICEDTTRPDSIAPRLPGSIKIAPRLTFLSIRPKLMEARTRATLSALAKLERGAYSLLLAGSLESAGNYVVGADELNGVKKFDLFRSYAEAHPESEFVLFGDAGEGDLRLLQECRRKGLRATLLLRDIVLECGVRRTTGASRRRELWEKERIFVFDNAADAALHLFKLGLLASVLKASPEEGLEGEFGCNEEGLETMRRVGNETVRETVELLQEIVDRDVQNARRGELLASVDRMNKFIEKTTTFSGKGKRDDFSLVDVRVLLGGGVGPNRIHLCEETR